MTDKDLELYLSMIEKTKLKYNWKDEESHKNIALLNKMGDNAIIKRFNPQINLK